MNSLRTILFAEDSPHDIELTLEAFAAHNLVNRVVVVNDGAEALDYLHLRGKYRLRPPGNPAVALLDVKMPRVDGLEVLREIKQTESLKRIPVVMLTSSREESDLMRSYELGANAYVVKPVEFEHFMSAVSQLGAFWAILNEPVPDGAAKEKNG